MSSEKVRLDHGAGGQLAHELTTRVLMPLFTNPLLAPLHDGAILDPPDGRLAFSTDSYVVDPLFFPGGDIGALAVNGTVNDLAMCGAVPRYLSLGLIIEEGLAMDVLKRILESIRTALAQAGTLLVTGDTKVVPRGAADKLFINTSGIGVIPEGVRISSHLARPGDAIILSGTMADHGVAVLTRRQGLEFDSPVESDTAPLHDMVQAVLHCTREIHVLRDPTRGGVGTALNEIAQASAVGMVIEETALPMDQAVAGICELLGFDPLYLANEGKLLCFAPQTHAEAVLARIRQHPRGRRAAVIGRVVEDHPGRVVMATRIGGRRSVDMLSGEQLPRIC